MEKKTLLSILTIFFFISCATTNPDVFIVNYKTLQHNKIAVEKGNEKLIVAQKELIKEANEILKKGELYSVTYKKQIPPSQSKHDYYSIAPYWWPDERQPNGSPYIRKDGKVNPESREITDSYMVGNISGDVYKLGLAYFYTENEKYVEWVNQLIDVFFINEDTKMNPNFKFSQLIKGRSRSEGGSITIGSVSFIRLIEGVQLVKDAKTFDKQKYELLKKWFADFTNWMENNKTPSVESKAKNNIGVYYTAQVIAFNMFIGNKAKAKKILKTKGKIIVDDQIETDGSLEAELNRATPWEYVKYTLSAFDYLVQFSEKLGGNLYYYENEKGGSIEKMYQWLIPYANADKKWNFGGKPPSSRQVQRVLLRSNIQGYKNSVSDKNVGLMPIEILTNNVY